MRISPAASRGMLLRVLAALGVVAVVPAVAGAELPRPDHVVVVVLENHSFAEIVGSGAAPFLDTLATRGATFTRSFAVAHPSEPNYLALFSGSTQGVRDDGSYAFRAPTLAGSLRAAGLRFVGYVEHGSPRKHNPWESFADSAAVERDLAEFPRDFAALPTVSFVIPNLDDDMHDGSIAQGDAWLRRHLGGYADWCGRHNSLLIVTFDEDDDSERNRIATLFIGASVKPGRYDRQISHYSVLRTIETMYGLPALGDSAHLPPITEVWRDRSVPEAAE